MKKRKKMSDFGKDRKRDLHVVGHEMVEIPCYDPHDNITVPDYKISVNLSNLKDGFYERCMEFLKMANPDSENGSYMDQVIDKVVAESISLIKYERKDHEKLIRFPIHKMHIGDKVISEETLEVLKHDLEALKEEHATLKRIMYRGTSFEIQKGGV